MRLARLAGDVAGWLTERELAPEIRAELMASLIQRRPAVYIASAAILLMSAAAAWLLVSPLAIAWFAIDVILLAWRLILSFRYDRDAAAPVEGRAAVATGIRTQVHLPTTASTLLCARHIMCRHRG